MTFCPCRRTWYVAKVKVSRVNPNIQ